MEKTDTIILSPEELAAYMAESTISVTSTYEHSPVVLMVDDTVIGTLGNFSASIGKAKSKKTFNVSAIVASALSGSSVLHYRSTFPENKRKILYIDTEQARAPMYNRNAVRLYLGISRNSYLLMLHDKPYRMRIVNWHSDRKHRMIRVSKRGENMNISHDVFLRLCFILIYMPQQ